MKTIKIIFAMAAFTLTASVSLAQKPVIAAKDRCLLTKSAVPQIGGLRLGASFAEVKRQYPGIVEMDRPSPAAGTKAYVVREPIQNISLIAFIFSTQNTLATYTLYYQPQNWSTLEEPTRKMIETVGLTIPKSMWDFFHEDGKDAITVECKDFGFYTSFKRISEEEKYFNFTVVDRALVNKFGSNRGNPASTSNSRGIPSITSSNSSPYVFPNEGSEFTVTFPSRPTIRTVSSDYGTVEEATVSTTEGTLRAEYGLMSAEQRLASQTADDESLRQSGLGIARMFGYTGATVTVLRTPHGKCFKIRGYKTVSGTPVLIEHYGYFGDRTIMTLITATKADEYPTRRISDFLSSIRRR